MLEEGLVHQCAFQSRSEAYDAISFTDVLSRVAPGLRRYQRLRRESCYNATRRRSTNNYIMPVAFELTRNPRRGGHDQST